jgi:surface antigen
MRRLVLRHRLMVVSALSLILPALVIGTSLQVQAIQRQPGIHATEARQLAQSVAVARYQALDIQYTSDRLRASQTQAGELQQALDTSNADRDAKQQKIDELQKQVDALTAYTPGLGSGGSAVRTVSYTAGAIANHFPFGWCTYYVASRRSIPWMGNAITWMWGARSFGFPTGSAPRAGAIMVTAESGFGHVAYVEAVHSDGTFVVSEMNYTAWGADDFRTVVPGKVPVLGFIY